MAIQVDDPATQQDWTAVGTEHGPVGIADVGAGYWGPNLIRNALQSQSIRLIAVCDTDLARAGTVAPWSEHVGGRLVASVVGRDARVFRDFSLPRALRLRVGDGTEAALC